MKRIIDTNPTDEELGYEACPECDKTVHETYGLHKHMKEEHPKSVDDYTWSEENAS